MALNGSVLVVFNFRHENELKICLCVVNSL